MNQGLTKLAMDTRINNSNIYASIEEPIKSKEFASADPRQIVAEVSDSVEEAQTENSWGIQIGAFSNYAKARNYALSIKKEVVKKDDEKVIDVEPCQKGAAIVYRSKIVGFDKKEAANACKKLKKSNKSCIVIAATKSEITLANKL